MGVDFAEQPVAQIVVDAGPGLLRRLADRHHQLLVGHPRHPKSVLHRLG
ncbi:hypothetical protein LBW94_039480 [Nocardia sp. alder85J]|nr:hypothetical protein [Nocardia sp. alder85J]